MLTEIWLALSLCGTLMSLKIIKQIFFVFLFFTFSGLFACIFQLFSYHGRTFQRLKARRRISKSSPPKCFPTGATCPRKAASNWKTSRLKVYFEREFLLFSPHQANGEKVEVREQLLSFQVLQLWFFQFSYRTQLCGYRSSYNSCIFFPPFPLFSFLFSQVPELFFSIAHVQYSDEKKHTFVQPLCIFKNTKYAASRTNGVRDDYLIWMQLCFTALFVHRQYHFLFGVLQ